MDVFLQRKVHVLKPSSLEAEGEIKVFSVSLMEAPP